jgi:predicted nucleic acid-binding protein
MKVLLDTNIIIHRESHRILNKSIGQLFNLLDKGKFDKCVHPITLQEIEKNSNLDTAETFSIKLESYEQLQTVTPLRDEVKTVSDEHDTTDNDKNDTLLLNEILLKG